MWDWEQWSIVRIPPKLQADSFSWTVRIPSLRPVIVCSPLFCTGWLAIETFMREGIETILVEVKHSRLPEDLIFLFRRCNVAECTVC
jgi:hypothetical protein